MASGLPEGGYYQSTSGDRGYRDEGMLSMIDHFQWAVRDTFTMIGDKLQNRVIIPISNAWYGPDAVKYFSQFDQYLEGPAKTIVNVSNNFINYVQQTADKWHSFTNDANRVSLPTVDHGKINIDVSVVKNNNMGAVVFDIEEVKNIVATFPQVEEELKNELVERYRFGDEYSFIGGGQVEALQNCIKKTQEAIHDIFRFLTEDTADMNSIRSYMDIRAKEYEEQSQSVAGMFDNYTGN